MNLTKDNDYIKEIFEKLKLPIVESVCRIPSSQNFVYKVETKKDVYAVKQFSKDAISNSYALNKKKKQILFAKKLDKQNINVILPLTFNKREFICYKGNYYLIYKYYNYKTFKSKDITLKHIEVMAHTLAKINKEKIKLDLPCHYKSIDINFENYIKQYNKIDKKLSAKLIEHKKPLEELVKTCNENLKYAKRNLCISHNDYKLLNMLWKNSEIYLIDFDAVGLVNPTVAMLEAAYSLSKKDAELNLKFFEKFITVYSKILKVKFAEYEVALNVAMNGKLKWFRYILDKGVESAQYRKDVISMIGSFSLYLENKVMMQNIGKRVFSK